MWTWHIEKGLSQEQQGQYSKHIYLGETRIVTKQTSDLEEHYGQSEEKCHQYYYHPDHLGSAQLVTDYEGNEYQRIEYTPYGELWVEKKTAHEKDMRYLPYKFTAKEQDEETGLYYYGARYLDAKYSRWMSADPAVGDYIPVAPTDDEAKKHNEQLPGMGGVYNVVNFQLYHYAGNNPVKYVDPDGRASILQRVINDSETNRKYHYAHIIGKITGNPHTLHGLVDFGELGGFSKDGSVSQYSGNYLGFTDHDRGSKTNRYTIVYTGMDDKLTEQAVKNVLATERFGAGDPKKQKEKYEVFKNDCNDYTKAVFEEYENLWKEKYKQDNPKAWKIQVNFAWLKHFWKISKRQGEIYEEK